MEGQETYLRVGIDGSSAQSGARVVQRSLSDIDNSVNKSAQTWKEFVAANMSGYMKMTGSHGAAMKAMGDDWQKLKSTSDSSSKGVIRNIDQISRSSSESVTHIAQMKEALMGIAKSALGIYGTTTAIQAIGNYAKETLNYLGLIETASLGIASSFLVSGQYIDRTTKTALTGQAALRAAQSESASVINQLRYANLQTIATLDELVIAYQTTLPVAMARGFDKKQVMEFTKTMVQAAGAIGLPFNQMAEETRSLLVDGAINPRNSRIATVLGLRSEDIAQYKGDAQGLFDFLQKRLEGFAIAGKASMDTWKGLWSNLKDMSQQISGKMFEGVFDGVKVQVKAITESMFTIDDKLKTITMKPEWENGIKSVSKAMVDLMNNVVAATKYIYNHWAEIKTAGEAYLVYKVAMMASESIQKIATISTEKETAAQVAKRQSIISVFDAESVRLSQATLAAELSAKNALAVKAEADQELLRASVLQRSLLAEQEIHNAKLAGLSTDVAVATAQKNLTAKTLADKVSVYEADVLLLNSQKTTVVQHLALIDTEMAALQAKSNWTKADYAFEKELRNQQFNNINRLITIDLDLGIVEGELAAAKRNGALATEAATIAETKAIATRQTAINTSARYGIQILAAKEQEIAANIAATAAQNAATVAIGEHTVAVNAATLASRAYTAAKGLLASALTMLGGPIGAITTLLTLGATAWMIWGNKSKTAADDAELGLVGVNKTLDEQIKKLEEIERLKKGLPKNATQEETAQGLLTNEQLKEYNDSLKRTTDLKTKLTGLGGAVWTVPGKSMSTVGGKDDNLQQRQALTMSLQQEEGLRTRTLALATKKKEMEEKQATDYKANPARVDDKEAEKLQRENDRIDKYNLSQATKFQEEKRKLSDASGKQMLEQAKSQSAAEITALENKYNVYKISQRDYEQSVYESQARVANAEKVKAQEHLGDVVKQQEAAKLALDAAPQNTNIQREARNELNSKYNGLLVDEKNAQTALNAAVAKEKDLSSKNTGRVEALDLTEKIEIAQGKSNLLAAQGGDLAAQAIKDGLALLSIHNDEVKKLQEQANKQREINALRELNNANRTNAAALVRTNPLGGFDNIRADKENALAVELEANRQILESIQMKIDAERALQVARETTVEQYRNSIARQTALEKSADLEKQVSAQKTAKIKADADRAAWTDVLNNAKKTAPKLSALDGFLAIAFKQYEREKVGSTKLSTNGMLQMAADYTGAAGEMFSSLADSQDQSSRKGFETAKAYNMAAAVMSTAAAIMNAMSSIPYPMNIVAAAATGVMGAIQIAKIASTSFGGGGTVASVSSGGFGGGSAGGASSVGGGIGSRMTAQRDSLSQDTLRAIAGSMENASLAIGKVADGLTKITDLFKEGSMLSLASKGAPGISGATGSVNGKGWFTATTGFNNLLGNINPLDVLSNIGSALFGWGNKFQTTGGGFTLGMSGTDVSSRNYVDQKKAGGLFSHSKTRTIYSEGNGDFEAAVQSAVNQLQSTIIRASVSMGTSASLGQALIPESKFSTAGRKPEDIQKDLEKWFTDASNVLAKTVIGLQDFAFYGEDAFAALVRLSTALQSTNEQFELIGAKIVKSTLEGANSAWKLQDMMGGSDKFNESIDKYFTSMFSDNEQKALKAAQAQRQINVAFAEMGRAVPKTRADFRNLVNSLNVTTDAGAKTFAALMDISEAFALVTNKATESAKTMVDKTVEVMSNAASAIKDILLGPLTTKSPEELYKEQQVLFASALANGRAAELPDLGKSLLEASRAYNASGAGYLADYNAVLGALGEIAGIDGTPTLEAAERQVQILSDMKDGVEGRLDKVVDKLAALEESLRSIETTTRLVANS